MSKQGDDKRARFDRCVEDSLTAQRLGKAIETLYNSGQTPENPIEAVKTSLAEQSAGDSKELQREISELKSRNADLERRVEELKKEGAGLGRKPQPAAKKKAGGKKSG